MNWLRDNWLKVHLAISPLGTLGVTWLLISAVGSGQWWRSEESLELAGQASPFGGIIYGSSILVLEVTVRMLWALAQRHKDMEKARVEERQRLIREMVERGVNLPPDMLKDLKNTEER